MNNKTRNREKRNKEIKRARKREIMVLILEGNSEIGEHVWSEIGYLICLRH